MPQAAYWTGSIRNLRYGYLYIYVSIYYILNGGQTQIGLVVSDWIGGNLKRIASPITSARSNAESAHRILINMSTKQVATVCSNVILLVIIPLKAFTTALSFLYFPLN